MFFPSSTRTTSQLRGITAQTLTTIWRLSSAAHFLFIYPSICSGLSCSTRIHCCAVNHTDAAHCTVRYYHPHITLCPSVLWFPQPAVTLNPSSPQPDTPVMNDTPSLPSFLSIYCCNMASHRPASISFTHVTHGGCLDSKGAGQPKFADQSLSLDLALISAISKTVAVDRGKRRWNGALGRAQTTRETKVRLVMTQMRQMAACFQVAAEWDFTISLLFSNYWHMFPEQSLANLPAASIPPSHVGHFFRLLCWTSYTMNRMSCLHCPRLQL